MDESVYGSKTTTLHVVPQKLVHPVFPRQGFSLAWSLLIKLVSMIIEVQGSACLYLPSAEITLHACGSLYENVSPRLKYLNTWSPVVGAAGEGGIALLEEVHHQG